MRKVVNLRDYRERRASLAYHAAMALLGEDTKFIPNPKPGEALLFKDGEFHVCDIVSGELIAKD